MEFFQITLRFSGVEKGCLKSDMSTTSGETEENNQTLIICCLMEKLVYIM